jgi:hypothetical protein
MIIKKCKLIFLLCIIFFVEFRIFRVSTSNVISAIAIKRVNRHMQRVLRKIHRKKKKTHWLRGVRLRSVQCLLQDVHHKRRGK